MHVETATFRAAAVEAEPLAPAKLEPVIERIGRPGPWLQHRSAKGFEWIRSHLPVPNLPAALDGLRIVHLTDFHARGWWDPAYDELQAAVAEAQADLVLCTGDYVDDKRNYWPALPIVRKLLSGVKSRLGTFAILGNHDGNFLAAPISDLDATIIDNRRLVLSDGEASIELIGLPGVDRHDLDLRLLRSYSSEEPGSVRIVLSHFPDLLPRVSFLQPDLYLAGHTHGGQICLPWKRPIIRHDSLPRRMCQGIHRAFGTWMVVGRGFGFSSRMMLRLFCPAEINEIVLKRATLPV